MSDDELDIPMQHPDVERKPGLICDRRDCHNEAVVRPQLRLWPAGYDRALVSPAIAEPSLKVCAQHRDSTTVADFITDAGWRQIEDNFRRWGAARPERSTVELHWDPLQ